MNIIDYKIHKNSTGYKANIEDITQVPSEMKLNQNINARVALRKNPANMIFLS